MSARRFLAAAAMLGSASVAAAFVRTQSETTGVPLSWRVPVVGFHVNPTIDPARPNTAPSCDPKGAAGPALAAVQASFAEWQQPCADLTFVYGGVIDDIRTGVVGANENVVVFRRGWCSQNALAVNDPCFTDPSANCGALYDCFEDTGKFASHSIVALTSVLYDPASGRIIDADVEVNGWDGSAVGSPLTSASPAPHGWYFTCLDPELVSTAKVCVSYGDEGCHYIDLQATVTHEAGHFSGLAHPCGDPGLPSCLLAPPAGELPYSERTMSPTTTAGDVGKRSLSADDIAGMCAAYPPPSGGCGCGSGGAAGTVSLLVAMLALRRRRSI